jgi:hypothetical protein
MRATLSRPVVTDRDADIEWFRSFVQRSGWHFARTYVNSYPHEWTHEREGDQESLARAVECIERWGIVESFWRAKRKYLYLDDRKYWHMGRAGSDDPNERPTLINRTWLDVSRYRPDARASGYDSDRLEKLVDHWKTMLRRANS